MQSLSDDNSSVSILYFPVVFFLVILICYFSSSWKFCLCNLVFLYKSCYVSNLPYFTSYSQPKLLILAPVINQFQRHIQIRVLVFD